MHRIAAIARTGPLVATLALLAACQAPEEQPPVEQEDQGPCGDTWGPVPEDGRIYVDAAADEDGDGSLEAPFVSIFELGEDSALQQARETGIRSIAIAPGEYEVALTLSGDVPDWLDNGLEIAGCGTTTELLAVTDDQGVPEPIVEINGAATADVVLRDFALVGGRRAVLIAAGAGADGPIILERLTVLDSVRSGVVVDGYLTRAHLLDVDVSGVIAEETGGGWGVLIRTQASPMNPLPAPNLLDGVTVEGAHQAGIVASGAWVDVVASRVSGTSAVDGRHGRGIQFQMGTRGTLDTVTLEGNADAALFLDKPGREGEAVYVLDCLLTGTSPADVPDTGETSGDGLVLSQHDAGVDPAEYLAIVQGTTFSDNPRAHLLVESVGLQVDGESIFGSGNDFPFVSQGGAIVEGVGGGEPEQSPEELGAADALGIDSEPINVAVP
jgi:hypothetical protein